MDSSMSGGEESSVAFDKILNIVGDNGKFQKHFNLIFNIGLVIAASMLYHNIILALNVPEHWCHVPGRELTNYTSEEWKELTIPTDVDKIGQTIYKKCEQFNLTSDEIINGIHLTGSPEIISCKYGWHYNTKYYHENIITQENWVCNKSDLMPNAFVFDRLGETIGIFIFGQLGDTLGRRFIFNLSIFALVTGRIIQIFTGDWYLIFAAAAVSGSLLASSVFQAPLIISMEITKPEYRARNSMLQGIFRSVGCCIIPLVFWLIGEWKIYMWITSVPLVIFWFFPKYMIESPRWLATIGKWEQSAKYLKRISKINGIAACREITGDYLKENLPQVKEKRNLNKMGSLFKVKQLGIYTILLSISWSTISVGYFTLILNISQMPGNPFLNFFGQSIVEIPSYFIGEYLCNRLGRRLTSVFCELLATVLCIIIIFVCYHKHLDIYTICLCICLKFCASIAIFSVYLQCVETYPTYLRQTGISLCMTIANILGIIGPHIVVLGTDYDPRYPFIIFGILFSVATLCGIFLPETLYEKLPDSLDDAKHFGKSQKFWQIPTKSNRIQEIMEKSIHERT